MKDPPLTPPQRGRVTGGRRIMKRKSIPSEGGDRGVWKNRRPVIGIPTPNPSPKGEELTAVGDQKVKKTPLASRGRVKDGIESTSAQVRPFFSSSSVVLQSLTEEQLKNY
ncbi:MAG: hypothetical protein IJ761_00390 [Bacteroidales bacterium]|nr:hypothetical protein [Bacteroidales bacterium]